MEQKRRAQIVASLSLHAKATALYKDKYMTCPTCKERMEKPNVEEPFWWCPRCGHTVPKQKEVV